MGQQLFKVQLEISDSAKTDGDIAPNSDAILSASGKDDISFFFPLKMSATTTTTSPIESSSTSPETIFIKQIQNQLALLTKSAELKQIDDQINEILTGNVSPFVETCYKTAMKEITDHFEKQQRLQTSLTNKFKEDNYANVSIFAQPFGHS